MRLDTARWIADDNLHANLWLRLPAASNLVGVISVRPNYCGLYKQFNELIQQRQLIRNVASPSCEGYVR